MREGWPWILGSTVGDFSTKPVALAFESQLQGQSAGRGLRAKVEHAHNPTDGQIGSSAVRCALK
eukprot:COSAG05_NODE_1305_length_5237_cov_35.931685_5_plen_64_part_00